jgi:hypothetical protein
MSGWWIALIVAAVIFVAGAICCNTIGRKVPNSAAAPASAVSVSGQDENR